MKYSLQGFQRSKGFVTIVAVLFLLSVVLFILGKSLSMSSSKSIESQQYLDSIQALAMAENGMESAKAYLTQDTSQLKTRCDALFSSSPPIVPTLTGGTFSYTKPSLPSNNGFCAIRARGTVGKAQRTIEAQFNLIYQNGTAGHGDTANLTISNPYPVPAVALFNLAWQTQDPISNTNPIKSNICSGCSTSNGTSWNTTTSGGGTKSVGSMGTVYPNVAANFYSTISQTLYKGATTSLTASNYAEVGIFLGGSTGAAPSLTGMYYGTNPTQNNNTNALSSGSIPWTSSGSNWCDQADTLVFAASARVLNDNVKFLSPFSSVIFGVGLTQQTNLSLLTYFPIAQLPNVTGEVVTGIWYAHNYYAQLNNASATLGSTSITVPSTTSLIRAGTILKVQSGGADFANVTRVTADVPVGSVAITVDKPVPALTNATLCGGICAFFNSTTTQSTMNVTRLSGTNPADIDDYTGGLACFKGVEKGRINPLYGKGSLSQQLWHEVISTEAIP
jgi:hypothetical protein